MASILKRSKKPGAPYYIVYTDATGKQKWLKGYTDKSETQQLANRLENQKVAILRGDIDPQHEQRKIERAKDAATHIAEYRDALEAKGNDPIHVNQTINYISQFVEFSKVTNASAITRPMMDRWVLSRQPKGVANPDDSRRTVNLKIGAVQAWLKHLHGQGTLSEYVLYRYPKLKTAGHERRVRRSLTEAEKATLLGHDIPAERKEMYRFSLLTGARFSHAKAVKVKDVDFSRKTVALKSKDNQHRNREHVVPMHPSLVEPLKKLCVGKARDAKVFDNPPPRTHAARMLRADCKLAGIDTTHVDYHALRHTFCSLLAAKGVHPKVLQALAGHAKVETTLNYYTHFKRVDETAAIALL